MTIAITCPGCRAPFDVPENLRGKSIRCTACATQIKVPAAAEPIPLDDEDDAPPRPAARKSSPAAPARPAAAASGTRRPARTRDDDDDDFDDDRPRRKAARDKGANPMMWVGIGLAALVLVGGVGVGIYYATKKSDAAGGGGSTAAAAAGWEAVEEPNAFTVRMPSKPEAKPAPGVAGKMYELKVRGEDEIYVAGYFDVPGAGKLPGGEKALLDNMMRGAKQGVRLKAPGARSETEKPITVNGFAGREATISVGPKGNGVFRIVLAGERAFILAAGGDDTPADDPKVRMFLDSFQITYKPGEATKPPAVVPGPKSPPAPGPIVSRPADDWQPVPRPDGFAAEMPRRPIVTGRPGGGGRVPTSAWRVIEEGETFTVEVGPLVGAPRDDPRKALDLAAKSRSDAAAWVAGGGNGVRAGEPTDIALGGFPGKEVVYTSTDGKSGGVYRLYAVGDRFYTVVAAGRELPADSPRARRFLDSFKITYSPPASPVSPPAPPPVVAAPADWQDVAAADGFTAKVPGNATAQAPPAADAPLPKAYEYARPNGQLPQTFRIGVSAAEPLPPAGPEREKYLNDLIQKRGDEYAARTPGGLVARVPTPVTVGGHPGRQIVLGKFGTATDLGNPAEFAKGHLRIAVAGDREYAVYTHGLALDPGSGPGKQFFDSFKLTAAPPPDAVATNPDAPPGGLDPNPDMGFPGGGGKKAPLAARVEPFWAMAFDKTANEAYTVGLRLVGTKGAGVLRRYSLPDFKLKNSYNLPAIATRAVVDGERGVLYLSTVGRSDGNLVGQFAERIYAEGSLQAVDLKPLRAGAAKEGDELKPLWSAQLAGGLVGFEPAADGKGVYALTITAPKAVSKLGFKSRLAYVEAATNKVAKELPLDGAFRDLSWAADGKTLLLTEWPLGPGGQILPPAVKSAAVLVVDPVGWAKVKSVPLPGLTTDVTDMPGGRLVAAVAGNGAFAPGKLYTLDRDGDAKELKLPPFGAAQPFYARFTPDGKRLVVSSVGGKGGVDVYDVADATSADGYKRAAAVRTADALPLYGYFHLTPDGTRAAFRTGAVIDLAEVAKGK